MDESKKPKTAAESFDHLAKDYDSTTNTFHHKISHFVLENNLLEHLNGQVQLKILDSGGGTGKYSVLLKQKGFDVTLTDISSKSIEIARAKFEKLELSIPSYVCDSENTSFQDSTFDLIMFNGAVISYTASPKKLVQEAHRILKHGGHIWLDFFNSVGWAIEINDLNAKAEIAIENDRLIQMPDWDHPARLMSLKQVEHMLSLQSFVPVRTYGLINLSHSLPLETRYSNTVDEEILRKYQTTELDLSRRADCIGTAWSCMICAKKVE